MNLTKIVLADDIRALLSQVENVTVPTSREELFALALGAPGNKTYQVSYEVPGQGEVVEAEVVRCKNGVAVNYMEMYKNGRAHV